MFGRSPGAEYSGKLLISFSEANQDQAIENGMTDNDFAVFIFRMGFVIENEGQWILEDSYGFVKPDAMLAQVGDSFLRIPLEFHSFIVAEF